MKFVDEFDGSRHIGKASRLACRFSLAGGRGTVNPKVMGSNPINGAKVNNPNSSVSRETWQIIEI